ncbi:hypothetical protein ACNFJ7_07055 [Sphingomonas sp. HT-1]|uniref:hypothetical protein n=1 Tax=unclassified Sphingomonas TaxID=196159 RepID=UPI0003145BDF|nr:MULTISPECIES: hypothetical protein [unclassified Sphingomonas]KTF68796.1 hypothetical protein ATB93_11965 [Sphingomonas sp. WG]
MNIATIRRYFYEAIEFLTYFVFMTVLGAAMYTLVEYAPQANAKWYINTCIAMAIFTGVYALRMYSRYRRWRKRLSAAGLSLEPAPEPLPEVSAEERRTLRWSERIAAERLEAQGGDPARVKLLEELEAVEREYRAKRIALGEDPDSEDPDFEIDPSMSLEAIRLRIADRMAREAIEEEESRRIFR